MTLSGVCHICDTGPEVSLVFLFRGVLKFYQNKGDGAGAPPEKRRGKVMSDRIVLNETSYHGAGAIQEIASEAKARGFRKAFVCSDPDLIKFGVTGKVLKVLDDA